MCPGWLQIAPCVNLLCKRRYRKNCDRALGRSRPFHNKVQHCTYNTSTDFILQLGLVRDAPAGGVTGNAAGVATRIGC
jgi:hypothetical protein